MDAQAALPRAVRLSKPADFKAVFKKPMVSSDRLFKILARANSRGHARLGMAVSRRVDRRAVARNRIKRVIRESFRRHFTDAAARAPGTVPSARTAASLDIVVLPRPGVASISNRQLFASLDAHWERLEARLRATSHG